MKYSQTLVLRMAGLAELAASSHPTPKTCQDVADKEGAWAAAAAASGMMTDDKLVTGGPSSYSCPAPPYNLDKLP